MTDQLFMSVATDKIYIDLSSTSQMLSKRAESVIGILFFAIFISRVQVYQI